MIDRDGFVAPRRARWDRLEYLLARPSRTAPAWSELAGAYRAVCADLAAARSRGLPDDVVRYLDELAGRSHNALYGARVAGGGSALALLFRDFPRELRREWRLFLFATLLFYGPFAVGMAGSWTDPRFAALVLPEASLEQMEQMYAGEIARGGGQDLAMAGFYVWNNIGIALRCFATGALAGLGSVFFLVYNGLVIGTIFGHLGASGLIGNLLAFTSGHTVWELTGIVVSGTAGLRLGRAVVVTEGRTRAGSLRAAAPVLFRLVAGATALLAVAALIEGFWSAGPVPAPAKLVFGALQFPIVAAWLLLGGRREGA